MRKHMGKTYGELEINELLQSCDMILDNNGTKSIKLTENDSILHNEGAEDKFGEENFYGLLEPLIGYTVSLKTEGEHHHDSSNVRYEFTFTSPEGENTKIITIMNLMNGFDYKKEVTFK
jgi:hypothetical protein